MNNYFRNILIGLIFLNIAFAIKLNGTEKVQKPNILIVIGDDCTYNDLPLYGGNNILTPHIDRLASEGMTFNHAYISMSMCAPARAELYTGLYPARNGVCWNYVPARDSIKSIAHYLGNLDYRVGLAGKTHIRPESVYPLEMVDGIERSCVSETAKFDDTGMREFINRDKNQPFCLIAGLVVPHIPWSAGDYTHFNLEKIDLPPNLADTKGIDDFTGTNKSHLFTKTSSMREDFARYLAEIEVMDRQLGKILKMLHETGESENTIVIFTSEQGSQFPGNKYTNWNTGVHTAFIVRWPGKTKAGVRTDALIQYVDVLPTLLDAVGENLDNVEFSGSSFLSVILGQSNYHRKYAYFMHNNVPEGTPYPIRAVTDGKYHYIRNLLHENLYTEKHIMGGQGPISSYWSTWMWDAPTDQHTYKMVSRYMKRPNEELYQMEEDPYNLENLAANDKYEYIKKLLSNELDRWLKEERDPGVFLDTFDEYNAAQNGNHFKR